MTIKNSTKAFRPYTVVVKFTSILFIYSLSFFMANSLIAQHPAERPGIFYAITGNGAKDTSWLFGTYHLVNGSYLSEMPGVMPSFKKAKGLVVEIVIDSSKLYKVNAMGMMKDKTLSSLLDKPFIDSLENELKSATGVGVSQMNQLKPATVTLTLSIVYLMKNNDARLKQYAGLPLDAHFVQEGKQTAKNITALETIEDHMNLLFNKITDEEQVNQLKLFLRNKNDMIGMGDELLQSWFDQDLVKMYSLYNKTVKLMGEADYLIKDRNDKWMKILPGLISKEPQFIAVGALHLAGPDGLLQQLKQKGYTITPIK